MMSTHTFRYEVPAAQMPGLKSDFVVVEEAIDHGEVKKLSLPRPFAVVQGVPQTSETVDGCVVVGYGAPRNPGWFIR